MLGAIIGGAIGLGSSLLGSSAQNAQADAAREAAQRNYEYQLKMREYEYEQQMRIYQKSKDVYKQQVSFNQEAAYRSYEAEMRKMDEYMKGLSFQKQDMMLQLVQEQGQIQARAQAGRSTGRLNMGVMSQFGRNQAVMAQNLISANRQYDTDTESIGLQKQSADLEAYARLMLRPEKPPAPPKPTSAGGVNPFISGFSAIGAGLQGYQSWGGTF